MFISNTTRVTTTSLFALLFLQCCGTHVTEGDNRARTIYEAPSDLAEMMGNLEEYQPTYLRVNGNITADIVKQDYQVTLEESIKNNRIGQDYSGEIVQLSAPKDELVYPSPKGFVDVATIAYNQHHDLVWRPDDVWQAILTQFSLYMTRNAEALRDKFVDFERNKKLTIEALGTLYTVDFGDLAKRMVDEQIIKNIKDPTIAEWILPKFTTTTENDRIVASVTMMATLKEYFEYEFGIVFGLPSVTLLGSLTDWKLLRKKLDCLQEFDNDDGDMTMWHQILSGILDEFIKTKSGIDNSNFWKRMSYIDDRLCGVVRLNGWITAFAAFDKEGKWQGGWGYEIEHYWPNIDISHVPSGAISVPVHIDDNGKHYDAHMLAGQFAFDGEGTSIQPRSDWCIAIEKSTP